jgi:hypothetical protein
VRRGLWQVPVLDSQLEDARLIPSWLAADTQHALKPFKSCSRKELDINLPGLLNMGNLGSAPSLAPDRILNPKGTRPNTAPSKDEAEVLDYAIKHVFVPPRLPNGTDYSPQLEGGLLGFVRDRAESFKDRLEPGSDAHTGWDMICRMLAASATLYEAELTENSVETALTAMAPGGEKDFAGFLYTLMTSPPRCTSNLHRGPERCHHHTTSHFRSPHFHP